MAELKLCAGETCKGGNKDDSDIGASLTTELANRKIARTCCLAEDDHLTGELQEERGCGTLMITVCRRCRYERLNLPFRCFTLMAKESVCHSASYFHL